MVEKKKRRKEEAERWRGGEEKIVILKNLIRQLAKRICSARRVALYPPAGGEGGRSLRALRSGNLLRFINLILTEILNKLAAGKFFRMTMF